MKQELPLVIERRRMASPAPTPQALTWDENVLWMGSRDLRRIYAIDPRSEKVIEQTAAPGTPWAAVATGEEIRFTLGEGPDDDRYIRRYVPESQQWEDERIECPDFTGSYLSFDGDHLYLSQWYKGRILQLDEGGNILRTIPVAGEICGHVFVDGSIYVLHGTEQNGEHWTIARLDPQEETPALQDLAVVPFACRSLTFDGGNFWSNHRAADTIISFAVPS
jgi:hypothetical protein